MAMKCPNCGQADTAALVADQNQCYLCGALFNAQGELVERGPDKTTREVMEARLRPRTDHPVGNYADLQRLGAQKVEDPNETAFPVPPGVDLSRVPDGEARSSSDVVSSMTAPVEQPAAEGRLVNEPQPADEKLAALRTDGEGGVANAGASKASDKE